MLLFFVLLVNLVLWFTRRSNLVRFIFCIQERSRIINLNHSIAHYLLNTLFFSIWQKDNIYMYVLVNWSYLFVLEQTFVFSGGGWSLLAEGARSRFRIPSIYHKCFRVEIYYCISLQIKIIASAGLKLERLVDIFIIKYIQV